MFKELLNEILKILSSLQLFDDIEIGQLKEDGGISIELGSGNSIQEFFDKAGHYEQPLLILCKNESQEKALETVEKICFTLSRVPECPKGDIWQITDMSIATTPNYVDKEKDLYIYSAIINISVYIEGGISYA